MKVGKLPSFPWYLRLLAFLAIGGVLYAGFWYFVTSGTRKATKEMQAEIADLKPRNAQSAIVQQNLNNFKALYKAREEEYAELKALLPEQKELTMVLQGIQDRAKNSGLVLMRFNPKEDTQQDNYSGKKIDVNVISGFTSLRAFFDQLAHYQRIVSITNFELKQMEKQSLTKTVEARFDLTAYYVSSERLNQAPAPNAKPAAGGAVPGGKAAGEIDMVTFRKTMLWPGKPLSRSWSSGRKVKNDIVVSSGSPPVSNWVVEARRQGISSDSGSSSPSAIASPAHKKMKRRFCFPDGTPGTPSGQSNAWALKALSCWG